jgi:ACS family hexuronate transporter-like MFS transporter
MNRDEGIDAGTGLSRGAAWALALVATLTMAVSYVDRQTLAVLAPTVTKALSIGEEQYGWLVSAFSISYLVGAPLAGKLIDAVGARRGLLGAVLLWSVVAALHALSPGLGVLFGLRVALGLAESPSFPGAAQTVHRALPPAERARGYGVLFTGSSIGAMLVPPIATALNHRYGWRVAVLLTAFAGLLWVPLWLKIAFAPGARRALDHPRVELPAQSPGGAPVKDRLTTLELLRHPAQLRAIALIIASAPFIAFMLNWGAKYLVLDHHLTQDDVGRYLWFPPLVFDAGAITFGFLSSRRARAASYDGSPDRLLVGGAVALALFGAFMPYAGGPWPAMLMGAIAMGGGGALYALTSADVLARVPPGSVSSAGGICAAAQSLSHIIAGPLVGRAVAHLHSYAWIAVALALWNLPGALLWLAWTPPPPHGFAKARDQPSLIS